MTPKKVLILAYEFPPYVSVAGLRPKSWFDYSMDFGYFPIVVTRQWNIVYGNNLDYVSPGNSIKNIIESSNDGAIVKAPFSPTLSNRLLLKYGFKKFKLLRKVLTAIVEILQFVLPLGSKKTIYDAANDYLSKNKVDAIIATGDPFILFKYAHKLSKKYKTPWIADYRDPWSNDMSMNNQKTLSLYYKFFEHKYLQSAALCTTVSEFVKQKIEEIHPVNSILVLPNGYDAKSVELVESIEQESKVLSISHAGSIFEWHPYEHFLSSISELISTHSINIRFNFYGLNLEQKFKEIIQNKYPNLIPHFYFYPKIPNQKLLEELKKSNLMLLFNYYSFMGTKIYDYIGIKRKILLCFSDDSIANNIKKKNYTIQEPLNLSNQLQADLIEKTNAGIVIKDAADLKMQLLALLKEFELKGSISCESFGEEQYSRKIQVKKLCEALNCL